MDDYLSKPFTMEALHTTLARWLSHQPAAASASPNGGQRLRSDSLDRKVLDTLRSSAEEGRQTCCTKCCTCILIMLQNC
jgi:response regulator of citrate/malate metabolism